MTGKLHPNPSRLTIAERIGGAMMTLVAGVCVWNFVRGAILLLSEQHVLNYTEGISMLAGDRVLGGQPLYPDIHQPPFVYLAYPPVYPGVCAVTQAIFGKSLLALRSLTVVCEVGVGALIYGLLRQERVTRPRALVFGALALGLFSVNKFHALARVDFLLLFFVLSVVWLLRRYEQTKNRWDLGTAGVLMINACMTKPTAAILFVPMGIYYIVKWRRGSDAAKRILITSLFAGGVYGLLVLGLQWATEGQFLLHTVWYQGASGARPGGFSQGPFARLFHDYGVLIYVPVAVALLVRRLSLAWILCVVSVVWLAISSMKAGADLNYTIEPIALLVVVMGLALGRREQGGMWLPASWSEKLRHPLSVGLLLAATLSIFAYQQHRQHKTAIYLAPILTEGPRQNREHISRFVAEAQGLLLVEEPYFAVVHDKPYWLSDPFHLALLAHQGRFDYGPVQEALRNGTIQRAVIGLRLAQSPGIWTLIQRHYDFMGRGMAMDENTWLTLWQRKTPNEHR